MCFDLDSRPPITPIAGGALDGTPLMLTASDRNRFAAFRARAAEPSGAAVAILPDHLPGRAELLAARAAVDACAASDEVVQADAVADAR